MSSVAKVPFCFVIGPIGQDRSPERRHSDLLLHAVIKHVLEAEEFGYKVKRADEDADPGMIVDRVISDIINADLVVADLTGLNPNVFYELGIRHSTEKPTIYVAKSDTILPFDNVAHRTTFVDLTDWRSIEEGRTRLGESARLTRTPAYQVSNPITQANASFRMRQSADPRDRTIAELQDRMASLEAAYLNASRLRSRVDSPRRRKWLFEYIDELASISRTDPLRTIELIEDAITKEGFDFYVRHGVKDGEDIFTVWDHEELLFQTLPRPKF
jgi:hypothetical protein